MQILVILLHSLPIHFSVNSQGRVTVQIKWCPSSSQASSPSSSQTTTYPRCYFIFQDNLPVPMCPIHNCPNSFNSFSRVQDLVKGTLFLKKMLLLNFQGSLFLPLVSCAHNLTVSGLHCCTSSLPSMSTLPHKACIAKLAHFQS